MDMEEVHLDGGSGNSGSLNTSVNTTPALNSSNVNEQFIGQMEQVFKAIDKNSTGVISLSQLRSEIEELGADIDDNPLIGQLIQYLRHVHAAPSDDTDGNELSSSTNEEDIFIDFESFVSSMTHFVEGVDPNESRRLREERLKLPKFKVPLDLLKKYNITPKGSPMLTPGASPGQYSHTAGFSPAKNKFGKMFSGQKPIIPFEQFQTLFTKLNYGKEIPKNKLLMFINDLPADADGCIDMNAFLAAYGGLNHPMSPKLIFEESDVAERVEQVQKSAVEWNKNNDIVQQLSESYKVLEKECETFQSEILFLEKAKSQMEAQLRKRDQEIERLKRETKFIDGMRDTNKELVVQNTTLKTQITKMNSNDATLRDNMESEKEKARNMEEQMILKDLEIKKLNHQIKTQQNINSKLSMMVSFVNETEKDTVKQPDGAARFDKSKTLKITNREKGGKPALNKQKSDFFDVPNRNSQPRKLSVESLRASLQAVSLQKEFEMVKEQDESELDLLKQQVQSFGEEISLSSFQPESEPISDANEQATPSVGGMTPSTSSSSISAQASAPSTSTPVAPSTPAPTTSTSTSSTPTSTPTAPTVATPSTPQTPVPSTTTTTTTNTQVVEPPAPIVIPIPTQTTNTQSPLRLSSPFLQTPPISSPRTILTSPAYVRQSSPAITDRSNLHSNPISNFASSPNNTTTTPAVNTLELPTISPNFQSNPNVGSIKRMKKTDLIRLQMSELEAHKESAQNLIDETTAALSNLYKNKDNELQRMQKMYNEEKQANKYLEKQLNTQLDKNKELNAGKEKNSWGGMQSFFWFVSHLLPSSLLCNVSGTS